MISRLILALLLSLPAGAVLADKPLPPNRYAASIVPAERFTVGETVVERHGSGPALILIPGLASGSWVWQETVRQFAPRHAVYVLTLPGFNGVPATYRHGMSAALDSVRQLIESRKLARPVVAGHSLGGLLALQVASLHPALVRGVVSIDGLPVFPGTEDWPGEMRATQSATLSARRLSPAAFAAQQQQYMSGVGTLDMSRAEDLALMTMRSDPAAVVRYMSEAIGMDLRPRLPEIKAPVLVLSPYAAVDGEQLRMDEAGKSAYYRSLMQGTPNVTVQSVSPSRHFAMFDQPDKVHEAIRSFIATLPK